MRPRSLIQGSTFVRGLSHVSIAVPDLEAACAQYARVFGIEAGETLVNKAQGVRLAYIDFGNAKLELISPIDASSPVASFLERHPRGGLHHFCLDVASVDAAIAQVEANGGQMTGPAAINAHGDAIAFVHPRSTGGVLIEFEAGSSP